jgi:alanine racemase
MTPLDSAVFSAARPCSRPIRARISLAALRHNYALARHHAPKAKAWAVIKANAYGHGQAAALAALQGEADGFALLEPETAAALRESGIRQPILLLEGIFSAADARLVLSHGITSVVHCLEQLEQLLAVATVDTPFALYLKLNTGMNRLGLNAAGLARARALLAPYRRADLTMMSHFAEADGARGIAWQLERFKAMIGDWRGPVSLGNSAAILRHPDGQGDWVRPGIMLYGASPFADVSAAALDLRPVMTLESRLIAVQTLAPVIASVMGVPLPPIGLCALAWLPAVTPTATRAMRRPARRLPLPASEPEPSVGCPWTCCAVTSPTFPPPPLARQ